MKISIRSLKHAKYQAFTLVEMVIVLAIIGVLAAATIVGVGGYLDEARMKTAGLGIDQLKTALMSYEGNNYSRPPTQDQGLMALHQKPAGDTAPKRWRQYVEDPEQLLDPWGNQYQYRSPAQRSGKRYDIFSMGEDGVESEDDIGNW